MPDPYEMLRMLVDPSAARVGQLAAGAVRRGLPAQRGRYSMVDSSGEGVPATTRKQPSLYDHPGHKLYYEQQKRTGRGRKEFSKHLPEDQRELLAAYHREKSLQEMPGWLQPLVRWGDSNVGQPIKNFTEENLPTDEQMGEAGQEYVDRLSDQTAKLYKPIGDWSTRNSDYIRDVSTNAAQDYYDSGAISNAGMVPWNALNATVSDFGEAIGDVTGFEEFEQTSRDRKIAAQADLYRRLGIAADVYTDRQGQKQLWLPPGHERQNSWEDYRTSRPGDVNLYRSELDKLGDRIKAELHEQPDSYSLGPITPKRQAQIFGAAEQAGPMALEGALYNRAFGIRGTPMQHPGWTTFDAGLTGLKGYQGAQHGATHPDKTVMRSDPIRDTEYQFLHSGQVIPHKVKQVREMDTSAAPAGTDYSWLTPAAAASTPKMPQMPTSQPKPQGPPPAPATPKQTQGLRIPKMPKFGADAQLVPPQLGRPGEVAQGAPPTSPPVEATGIPGAPPVGAMGQQQAAAPAAPPANAPTTPPPPASTAPPTASPPTNAPPAPTGPAGPVGQAAPATPPPAGPAGDPAAPAGEPGPVGAPAAPAGDPGPAGDPAAPAGDPGAAAPDYAAMQLEPAQLDALEQQITAGIAQGAPVDQPTMQKFIQGKAFQRTRGQPEVMGKLMAKLEKNDWGMDDIDLLKDGFVSWLKDNNLKLDQINPLEGVQGFLQAVSQPEELGGLPTWQKLAVFIGVPVAIAGMANVMFGKGGFGSVALGGLGLGAAALGLNLGGSADALSGPGGLMGLLGLSEHEGIETGEGSAVPAAEPGRPGVPAAPKQYIFNEDGTLKTDPTTGNPYQNSNYMVWQALYDPDPAQRQTVWNAMRTAPQAAQLRDLMLAAQGHKPAQDSLYSGAEWYEQLGGPWKQWATRTSDEDWWLARAAEKEMAGGYKMDPGLLRSLFISNRLAQQGKSPWPTAPGMTGDPMAAIP